MPGVKEKQAGLPTAGGPDFLVVGKIRRPHGVRGEVVAEIYTDFPERLTTNRSLFIGENHVKIVITSHRAHNEGLLLGFEGVTTPEQAGRYRNQILSIAAEEAPKLAEGEFYFHELLDMDVLDESGKILGELTEILETGANDVYVVTDSSGKEILLPAIAEVILEVDLAARTMKVRLLPGLTGNDKDDN